MGNEQLSLTPEAISNLLKKELYFSNCGEILAVEEINPNPPPSFRIKYSDHPRTELFDHLTAFDKGVRNSAALSRLTPSSQIEGHLQAQLHHQDQIQTYYDTLTQLFKSQEIEINPEEIPMIDVCIFVPDNSTGPTYIGGNVMVGAGRDGLLYVQRGLDRSNSAIWVTPPKSNNKLDFFNTSGAQYLPIATSKEDKLAILNLEGSMTIEKALDGGLSENTLRLLYIQSNKREKNLPQLQPSDVWNFDSRNYGGSHTFSGGLTRSFAKFGSEHVSPIETTQGEVAEGLRHPVIFNISAILTDPQFTAEGLQQMLLT